ncbi:MAG: hypothetical protein F6J97_09240 [Leptolyngbya sp. SIO4C1]|nr:hypothetical protein [Leptolyngbya sp. SIO4C1]
MTSLWITGPTRSGKTDRLILQMQTAAAASAAQPWLVLAANGDNRIGLANRLAAALKDSEPHITATPAGLIQSEVILFWPLLVETLGLQAQFPLKLRPENEQLLATQLWQTPLNDGSLAVEGWRESQTVRRLLDFLQLAASAGIPTEDIPALLTQGMPPNLAPPETWQAMGQALLDWRSWCLARGLLTYGIMTELYWRHLLPQAQYQARLQAHYCGILADDVDEYPAIAADLFQVFMAAERPCAFTYNPQGKVRLGVGADPQALAALAERCEPIVLPESAPDALGHTWADSLVDWVTNPLALPELPESVRLIQATTRGRLLREVAEFIAAAIHARQAAPSDIAVIGPGLDAIARYSLIEILGSKGIAIESLNDQRPLISSPLVRALLTLLTLVYPGLGRLCDRDAVAEMLVVLSQSPTLDAGEPWFELTRIDPVRAELIADHCFVPDVEQPHLLPVENFPRWDRLGFAATTAYQQLLEWIAQQQQQRQQRLIASPVLFLDRAVQQFLWRGSYLPADQLSALRELMETAQYFWEVEGRLQLYGGLPNPTQPSPAGRFIELLQRGTVAANPYPARSLDAARQGVTLATVFQYRAQRLTHRWQFWLDAGSPRWLTGKDELFGAPLFLSDWSGHPVTATDTETMHEARLERILRDLLGRSTERVFLCHSDLALNGQEQIGPLLTLVNGAEGVEVEEIGR